MAPLDSLWQILTSGRHRHTSHNVVSPTQGHAHGHDVYSHPEAVAYAVADPQRTIHKFGPYLLLKTLGKGEFGKVKLGLHSQWGDEVAVKLIRRGDADTNLRMSGVERKIEMLKSLKHPNIIRLCDVIETDKYIGVVLEYASGGNLFEHVVLNRYIHERDAAKLFSQLVSGVRYIHQEKIVHRNLKLRNILLDRHRNVVITGFGFAKRFEEEPDDLMFNVGSAVDSWNCGVVLYAMLTGYYWQFDSEPASSDRKSLSRITSHYKYSMSAPWSFPNYMSPEARDLLSMILVPDSKKRTTLEGVMKHPWLASYCVGMQGQPQQPQALESTAMDQRTADVKYDSNGLSSHRHGHGQSRQQTSGSEESESSPGPATNPLPTPSAQPCPNTCFHPSVMAYAAAYPHRTILRFGPYLMLQTLQKTEFGWVKLGLHTQSGVEVAVKVIRRRDLDSSLQMSKVEREIDVLKTVKHRNLIRLYDILETDKFIGIVLEYPSGGLPEYVYDYAKFEESWATLYEETCSLRLSDADTDAVSGQSISEYSLASSRTATTNYGIYFTRWAISQESLEDCDE